MFIVQSLCDPVNENLMQLLIMIDAAKKGLCEKDRGRYPVVRLLAPGPQDQTA